jgi:transcriptional regulator with XRE-family HTH domain
MSIPQHVDFSNDSGYHPGVEGFGPRLRALRKQRHVPTKDVLDCLEWSRGYLSLVERGLRTPDLPSWDRFERLARRLGVASWELAGLESGEVGMELVGGQGTGSDQRKYDALRLLFTGLATRDVAEDLDAVRRADPAAYQEYAGDLVNALEANIVLTLRILRVKLAKRQRSD